MCVTALAALEGDRNYLPALCVVTEPGRVRHADKLEFYERLVYFERFRHKLAQLLEVSRGVRQLRLDGSTLPRLDLHQTMNFCISEARREECVT
jgi:hypothetical protein